MGRLARFIAQHRTTALGVVVLLAVTALMVRLRGGDQLGPAATPAPVQPTPRLPLVNGSTSTLPALGPDGSVLRFGETGSSSCTNPATGQEWRVTWTVADSAAASPLAGRATLTATAFDVRIGAGDWLSQDASTWALRWTPTLYESLNAGAGETFDRRGPLSLLASTAVRADQAPRYVTPDGACTVYPVPFGVGPASGPASGPSSGPAGTVGVLGDSLLAQLSAPDGDGLAGTGAIYTRLRGVRVGVDAQAGRMWTQTPDPYPPLDVANGNMLDEIRGMTSADTLVIALGANDAGWVTLAPEGQRETRMAWMLLHLAPIIDELDTGSRQGRCTVLLTVADRKTRYLHSTEADYADAAGRLNDYLRKRVADSKGHLRLSDWAAASTEHHPGDPDSWFGPDTLHLSTTGRAAYADQIAAAPALC